MAVLSNQIYSPQEFVEEITGEYYIIHDNADRAIHAILRKEGYENNTTKTLWDYPLDDISEIVANEINVVLVDVSGFNKDGIWVEEYRWFEVPDSSCENFKEEEDAW